MKREEPISKFAALFAAIGLVAFWEQAGTYLWEAVIGGYGFKDPDYALRQIFGGVIFLVAFSGVAFGIQILCDIKWLLKNRLSANA